jgi:ribosomal protein S18 acetylase RimI-like enzyme
MLLQIRRAQLSDIPEIVQLNGVVQNLHAQMSPDIFRADWEAAAFEEFWRKRLNEQADTVALAMLNGVPVGYIWFQVQDRPQDAFRLPQRRMYIHHIAVKDKVRRSGIGTQLLEHAEAEAQRLSISDIVLDVWASNSTSHAFFNSRGYCPVNLVLKKTVELR